jgi:hypothetical protein
MNDYRRKCLENKEERCGECGSDENIVVHHVDGDREHNELQNLLPLCRSCHTKVHRDNGDLSHLTSKLPDEKIIFAGEPQEYEPRGSLQLSDERKRLLDKASAIVASGPGDDPPRSDVIDAALAHLIDSKTNLDDVRDAGDLDPATVKRLANTRVLRYKYRSDVDSCWR